MKQLKTFEFASSGTKGTYDWEKLLDGGIYQLKHGDDFECKVSTMATLVRKNAAKKGKGVKIAVTEDGLVIQAVEKPADEK